MFLKAKILKLLAGRPIAILHANTAKQLGLHVGERIRIKANNREIVAPIDITGGTTILEKDEIALSQEIINELRIKNREKIEISPALKPLSVNYIKKKLFGGRLTFTEIFSIISDIVNNKLTEGEVAYFVSGCYLNGMNIEEITSLTNAMVKTGYRLNFHKKFVIDKHSIGGVEGNRTTPIITSIIAAAIDEFKLDAIMPKTSSRAITSAAGTADVVETVAKVEFNIEEIKKIINKANACLVWGGSLGLAPADDKIIQVERLLALDPEAQLIASILSKKLAVNATHVLLDISYGKGTKMPNIQAAKKLKEKFEKVASRIGLNLKVVLTNGEQPIGNGIGPALEMLDIIKILRRDPSRPLDLESRALFLSSELLSFVLKISEKKAAEICSRLLDSGKAFKKFNEIIEAQQGSLKNLDKKLALARFKSDVLAKCSGVITEISNRKISEIARMAGSPADKGAGIFLYKHLHEKVKKNEKLFTIYAETKEKLEYAKSIAERINPIVIF